MYLLPPPPSVYHSFVTPSSSVSPIHLLPHPLFHPFITGTYPSLFYLFVTLGTLPSNCYPIPPHPFVTPLSIINLLPSSSSVFHPFVTPISAIHLLPLSLLAIYDPPNIIVTPHSHSSVPPSPSICYTPLLPSICYPKPPFICNPPLFLSHHFVTPTPTPLSVAHKWTCWFLLLI